MNMAISHKHSFWGIEMSTYRLRRFSYPDTLRAIAPERLRAFLQPYASYLSNRGVSLSANPGALDFDRLAAIFLLPDSSTPAELIDALSLVDEMSSLESMDALLEEASRCGLKLDLGGVLSPADVALQIWTRNRALLERLHAQQLVIKARSYESYHTDQKLPKLAKPAPTQLRALEQSLSAWFEERNRGRAIRILTYEQDDALWFLVGHGEPFKREECFNGDQPSCVCYRPLKYDVIVYHRSIGELQINARSKTLKNLYRKLIGQHIFSNDNFFPGTAKFSLEPLRQQGRDALNCLDVDGMEWVRLREVRLFWGGDQSVLTIRRADDLFEAWKVTNKSIPAAPRLVGAVFQVKFADARKPRSVIIQPSNIARYTRDADSALVERWLGRRGFLISTARHAHEPAPTAMVGT